MDCRLREEGHYMSEQHKSDSITDASGFQGTVIVPRHIPSPVKAYSVNIGRGRVASAQWEAPEWDLAECGRILDTESIVRRAFRNKKNLFTKEGYEFVGSKPERVQYVKRRFKQFEIATQIPTTVLMSTTFWSLIRTHNAFWAKVRNVNASGGAVRKTPDGKTLNPVAGYFPMASETIRFKRDEFGKLLKYRQEVPGKEPVEFAPEDVVHFYFEKREGFSVGTPSLVSVKDDIRALRRIEENVELLVYQHLFPLFHYQVGTEKEPAKTTANGLDEVQVVQAKIAQMPSDGCWVTPERHKITPLNTTGAPIAVDKVIEHYKQRIITGLGNSTVDMGEGNTANRSTADTMSRNLIDDTKGDQKDFAGLFEALVIRELLLESTFDDNDIFDEENQVFLQFKEIDFEARQARENHLADLYLKNAITHDELRVGMGYEPFTGTGWITTGDGEFARTNYGLIERDRILLQSIDEPGTPESKSKYNTESPSGGKSISNKNAPQNQYGIRPSAKINKDIRDSFEHGGISSSPSMDVIFKQKPPVTTLYNTLASDINMHLKVRNSSINEIQLLVDIAFSEAKQNLTTAAQRAYRIGLSDADSAIWNTSSINADQTIQLHVSKYVDKLHDDVLRHLKRSIINSQAIVALNAVLATTVMDALRFRARLIDNMEIMRAYNYGKILGYKANGFNELITVRNSDSDCEKCNTLKYTDTDAIIYSEILPLHPGCMCTVIAEGV
jgi:hypothetical protein